MKKINFWNTQINQSDYTYQKKIFYSNFPNEGKFTKILEKKVSKKLNVKHCIAVSSGTAALYIAIKILNFNSKDEIIVPNLTFPATANAVKMTSCKLILCDVDAKTLNIDIKDLKKKITKNTKAIIPVHVSGKPCDINEILKIAKNKNIKIIEDAAEAFLSMCNNKFLGTIGDMGCFSLSPNKIFTSGQGGLIVTNNNYYNNLIRLFKNQGRLGNPTGGDDKYFLIGSNFKLSNISSGLGITELKKVNERKRKLILNYKLYLKYLKNVKEINIIKFDLKNKELPLWVGANCKKMSQLFNFLSLKRVQCRKFWTPLSKNELYSNQKHNSFKNIVKIEKNLMWLPSSFLLEKDDIKYVCKQIIKFYHKDLKN